MALSQGQLNYWKKRTGRSNLTMGQAAYQRAQALRAPKAPAPPKPSVDTSNSVTDLGMPITPSNWQDSSYFAQLAQQRLQRQQRLTQLGTESQQDKTDFQENLRRFREMLPRQEESATESANRAGLLYSGHLGKNLGDIRTQAIRQESDMQLSFDRREQARAAARKALEDGGTIEDAAAAAEAVDRAIGRDQEAAGNRALVQESLIPPDDLDAGVDVGTPSPARGGRQNTNRTPAYLPRGYANWNRQRRSRYWARKRKRRK